MIFGSYYQISISFVKLDLKAPNNTNLNSTYPIVKINFIPQSDTCSGGCLDCFWGNIDFTWHIKQSIRESDSEILIRKKHKKNNLIPLVIIAPNYPRKALIAEIEGWVKLEFTITEGGTVVNPRVLESRPAKIFDREALRAILKYKFKPKISNGVALSQTTTEIIEFKLPKD